MLRQRKRARSLASSSYTLDIGCGGPDHNPPPQRILFLHPGLPLYAHGFFRPLRLLCGRVRARRPGRRAGALSPRRAATATAPCPPSPPPTAFAATCAAALAAAHAVALAAALTAAAYHHRRHRRHPSILFVHCCGFCLYLICIQFLYDSFSNFIFYFYFK